MLFPNHSDNPLIQVGYCIPPNISNDLFLVATPRRFWSSRFLTLDILNIQIRVTGIMITLPELLS